MVIEIAVATIQSGHEPAFEDAFAKAIVMIKDLKGFGGGKLRKSIDHDSKYYMFLEWATKEDHVVGFANSPVGAEAMKLLMPHLAGFPVADHVVDV